MKRILVSILLLITALLISKPFAAELSNFSKPAKAASHSSYSQTNAFEQQGIRSVPFSTAGCPCDTSSPKPTITLVLIAAIAASLAMASFIYGSHFIATWVAG
ncbi:MAG: hypothetical protein BroJett011_23120 [Chloroflexota bacterium]|nr:MAG: hypothetical protein BroJett011_23120 [Chloroflexota bacterium]